MCVKWIWRGLCVCLSGLWLFFVIVWLLVGFLSFWGGGGVNSSCVSELVCQESRLGVSFFLSSFSLTNRTLQYLSSPVGYRVAWALKLRYLQGCQRFLISVLGVGQAITLHASYAARISTYLGYVVSAFSVHSTSFPPKLLWTWKVLLVVSSDSEFYLCQW